MFTISFLYYDSLISVLRVYFTTEHCYNFIMTSNNNILCMYQKGWVMYICLYITKLGIANSIGNVPIFWLLEDKSYLNYKKQKH